MPIHDDVRQINPHHNSRPMGHPLGHSKLISTPLVPLGNAVYQCVSHRDSMTRLGLSTPKAKAWTVAIMATILARHGLLNEKLAIRSPAGVTRPSAMPMR